MESIVPGGHSWLCVIRKILIKCYSSVLKLVTEMQS